VSRRKKTHFREAVEQTPEVQDFYRPGLQALKDSEKQHVQCEDTRRLTGSLCLDAALKKRYPNQPVWDYAIGFDHVVGGEKITWAEFHSAASDHVDEVLRKLAWLKDWLAEKAPLLSDMTDSYCWVATKAIHITPTSRQAKLIASKGLRGPIKQLALR